MRANGAKKTWTDQGSNLGPFVCKTNAITTTPPVLRLICTFAVDTPGTPVELLLASSFNDAVSGKSLLCCRFLPCLVDEVDKMNPNLREESGVIRND